MEINLGIYTEQLETTGLVVLMCHDNFAGLNDGIKCVCQVFYLRQGINHWIIKVAFCTRVYLDVSCICNSKNLIFYFAIGAGYESILSECKHW